MKKNLLLDMQAPFTEDNINAGDYIVKAEKEFISDTGYLSTVLQKVCWNPGSTFSYSENFSNVYALVDLSDGLIYLGYYLNKGTNVKEFVPFSNKTILVDFLNSNHYNQSYRRATGEEVLRVVNSQKSRYL